MIFIWVTFMGMEEIIKRINELYHKSQKEGLTIEEKDEQTRLRKEYIASVRTSLKAQLDNIDIKESDGSITNLGEKFKEKKNTLNEDDTVGNIRTRKVLIRKEMLKTRSAMKASEVIDKSKIICSKITELKEYKEAKSILLYYPYNNETETFDLFDKAISDGKTVAFPKSELVNGEPDLEYYEITSLKQFENGYKGIMEPDINNKDLKKFSGDADLCICPGTAFDKNGTRLGYGKAFYDKYLREHNSKCIIGICYENQICDSITPEKSDVSMDIVVTEKNIYYRQ